VVAWSALVERLQLVPDERARRTLIRRLSRPVRGPEPVRVLAFANAHAFNLARRCQSFAQALWEADVLLRDGTGLAWLLRRCARPPGLNMNGTDFIPELLRACDGLTVAVLGTREPHLAVGLRKLQQEIMPRSRIWGVDGFAPAPAYVQLLRERKPAIVLLAMGMPRQEELAQRLRRELEHRCLLICGGAIVDFWAGRTRRAPAALQRLGLEWLWRLGQEPVRLFRRYVIGNPLFIWRVLTLRRAPSRPAQDL
jgi:exopolysaccharide biosynthesis WecB/TagA/CpsF family protein